MSWIEEEIVGKAIGKQVNYLSTYKNTVIIMTDTRGVTNQVESETREWEGRW